MSEPFHDLYHRKDVGPGLAHRLGDHLTFTDPDAGLAEDQPEAAVTWFIVSTEDEDRDGDIVRNGAGRWDLANFLKAGAPWLYDHGEHDSRVIGSALHPETGEPLIRFEGGRTLAGIHWDEGQWGQEIKGLVDRDRVRGASIGFLPKSGSPKRKPPGMGGKRKDAWDISSLELLELTITPTNSNTNALKLAIDSGELSPVVIKSFKKALGTLADTAGGVLGEKLDEKHVDEEAEFKGALDECVSRKVKILMDEGKDQKQALAIAYSMCGEKHMKMLNGETPPDEPMEKSKDSPHDPATGQFGAGGGGSAKPAAGKKPAPKNAPDRIREYVKQHFHEQHHEKVFNDLLDAATGNREANPYEQRALAHIFPEWSGAKKKPKKKPKNYGDAMQKAMDEENYDDPVAGDENAEAVDDVPDEVAPVEPHGVTVSRNCIEHVKALLEYLDTHGLPGMEPDSAMKAHLEGEVKPLLQELGASLHETASEQYPDHDFGEAPEVAEDDEPIPEEGNDGDEEDVEDVPEGGEEDEEADETPASSAEEGDQGEADEMDDEEEEEAADKYVRSRRALRKHAARKAFRATKAMKSVCMKAAGTMHKAADHLDESAEEAEEHKSYMHKGHAAMLRKDADGMVESVGGSVGGDDPEMAGGEDEGDVEAEKSVLAGAVRAAVRKSIAKALGRE